LIAAQPVDESALRRLGSARAEAIRALLVDDAGVDTARVRVAAPIAAKPSGERWIHVDLEASAGG